ncbi:MAG: AmmeMemoRadiSam system protein B [bacterium]|nr:AmmeMemoRadiSam system protein B [bacterium]
MIREPARAGSFYPAGADRCRREAEALVTVPEDVAVGPGELVGGIVPHAGWTYSGAVAGRVFAALAAERRPATVVLFGAVHRHRGRHGCLFGSGCWETPLGQVEVDGRLAERICGHTNLIVDDPYAHEQEHSIEVQIPLLQCALPEARIVPIMVPPMETAIEVGEAVGGTIAAYGADAAVVASTDLTHYGPAYGLTAQGVGAEALTWAKEVNDRRMIDLMLALDAEGIMPEAAEHRNACGAGAVAAALSAARRLGATSSSLLAHTASHEVMPSSATVDSVGYAGLVFHRASQPDGE